MKDIDLVLLTIYSGIWLKRKRPSALSDTTFCILQPWNKCQENVVLLFIFPPLIILWLTLPHTGLYTHTHSSHKLLQKFMTCPSWFGSFCHEVWEVYEEMLRSRSGGVTWGQGPVARASFQIHPFKSPVGYLLLKWLGNHRAIIAVNIFSWSITWFSSLSSRLFLCLFSTLTAF